MSPRRHSGAAAVRGAADPYGSPFTARGRRALEPLSSRCVAPPATSRRHLEPAPILDDLEAVACRVAPDLEGPHLARIVSARGRFVVTDRNLERGKAGRLLLSVFLDSEDDAHTVRTAVGAGRVANVSPRDGQTRWEFAVRGGAATAVADAVVDDLSVAAASNVERTRARLERDRLAAS